jgi:hypothetical protein
MDNPSAPFIKHVDAHNSSTIEQGESDIVHRAPFG